MRRPLTFETEYTPADFAAYQRFIIRRGVRRQAGVRACLAIGTLALFFTMWWRHPTFVASPEFLTGAMSMFAFVMIVALVNRRAFVPTAGGAFLRSQQFEFADEGIRTVSPDRETFTAWRAVRSWGETPTHLFLVIDHNAAIVVPRRCLGGHNEQDQLRELIRSRASAGGPS